MAQAESCSVCKWWKEWTDIDAVPEDERPSPMVGECETAGRCQRHPPVIVGIDRDTPRVPTHISVPRWPWTLATDVCSEGERIVGP